MLETEEHLKRTKQIEIQFYTVLAVLLTAIFSVILIGFVLNAKQTARHNREVQVNNCIVGNEFRENNRSLWDYLLALPPDHKPTPTEQKRLDDFKAFLNKTFMPRDCSKL